MDQGVRDEAAAESFGGAAAARTSKGRAATASGATALRSWAFVLVSTTYLGLIWLLPAAIVFGACGIAAEGPFRPLPYVAAPLVYAAGFVIVAAALGRLHVRHVVAGRFVRDTGTAAYFHRRLYGLCWTSVYYFPPIYGLMLAARPTRAFLFRAFGYKGSLSFTTYPDTWIRDLPLLRLGQNVYLSNRATLGTNLVLRDGTLLVDAIEIEEGALVGHLAKIGPGVFIGRNAQVGVGAGIGIKSRLGAGVHVGPMTVIEHYVQVGDAVQIGAHAYVGSRAKIAAHLLIPGGAVIPGGARLRTQADVERFCGRLPAEFGRVENLENGVRP